MDKFVHLHVHTEYSLLDGASRINDLLDKCVELGMDSIAITDHGVMYGVIDFYQKAKQKGLHPIIGCEVYMAPRSMRDKEVRKDSNYAHLVLLAKNQIGYSNIVKLVSLGFTDGFYYKPRIDYEILKEYSEGIIALSACIGGDIPQMILRKDYEGAKKLALTLNNIFGQENFYLELQDHGIEEQKEVNQALVTLSQETNIPLVATNDIHYVNRQDADAHDVLLCIQTGKTVDDENRMSFETREFYLKSEEEMEQLFSFAPEALRNTRKIADQCHVNFDFNVTHLPQYDVPEPYSSKEYLRRLCEQGLTKKYGTDNKEAVTRLDFELSVIEQMGYVDYFLIVWDFIKYARDHNIVVGPGRGSAAGSIVAYALDITQIDPLKYQLIFERFLNPDRISMPDIDIDFCYERRQEVIDYVVRKYGDDHVAQIITFGTMAARAVIRDVGRGLNISYAEVDRIAKMIPFELGMTIEKALSVNSELKALVENNPQVEQLINTSRALEGLPRHASTHAAGVVISKQPLTEHVPLQLNDATLTTQFPMGTIEQLGLLKMDFLGLRTLTVIRDTVDIIKQNKKTDIDITQLNLEDKKVYAMIGNGDTDGVFQLESVGMRNFLKELKPDCFEDIIAGISLYRPGPMEQIPRYIENKKHPDAIVYTDPSLAPILEVTYGCMVYQEQVMQIVRDLAGYSLGRSDLIRRAMSKKKFKVMQEERKNFIYGVDLGEEKVEGAIKRGVSEQNANRIFDEMMDFASYAFNKSHAAAYAMIAYQTAWLKYYYPIEFMASLMNSVRGNSAKLAGYIQYCRKHKIDVLPPDVNESFNKFTVSGERIRFGLEAVKNVGGPAVEALVNVRSKRGKYESFLDFAQKMSHLSINKRMVESLIKCGAFDSMKIYRSQLMAAHKQVLDGVSQARKNNIEGQVSLFASIDDEEQSSQLKMDVLPDVPEFKHSKLLAMEKETVGVYISGHPLDAYSTTLSHMTNTLQLQHLNEALQNNQQSFEGLGDGKIIVFGGVVTSCKKKLTRNNNMMAFVELEDLFGVVEVIVFPNVFQKSANKFIEDSVVCVKGKITAREEEAAKIICETVEFLLPDKETLINEGSVQSPQKFENKKLYIKLKQFNANEIDIQLKPLLEKYKGNSPVVIYDERSKKKMLADKSLWVNLDNALVIELKNKFGDKCVAVV